MIYEVFDDYPFFTLMDHHRPMVGECYHDNYCSSHHNCEGDISKCLDSSSCDNYCYCELLSYVKSSVSDRVRETISIADDYIACCVCEDFIGINEENA